ncbi:helix-turn-helix transcriptional regulator [Lactiplantibacillus sp. WILCCON 0030]|uniref:Helix-turn-helix transcriptional regulator n=1 Tax=Lactiplantibacillus brownii TaxID=3069269 RepID=A0ABU1A902_9LACO|nr:helix-turn-helix transcriptional regulator [Lactiplantibacillus brownii]MDQ7937461.1 helix-turn-helix transcriptional regulator [Lactiplantibacillus brownii]
MIQSQLKTILLDRTISNQELAAMTGINQKALVKIIDGRAKSISFSQLNTLIRVLDIELDELFMITPDLDLEVVLNSINENTHQFNGIVSFIDHDQQIQFDLPLTGYYRQNGSLFVFTLNDAFDDDLGSDGIATRLDQLLPVETMSNAKRALGQLLEKYPEQQAWFEADGMQLSDEPTDAELERYLQVGNLVARTQYERLHRLIEPLAMGFLAAIYSDFPRFLGNPQTITLPWGVPDTFRVFNFNLAESPESLANGGITKRQEQLRQQQAFPVSYNSLDVISYFSAS